MLIACEVLYRECYYCVSTVRNIVNVRILEQGLHHLGEIKMAEKLQAEIDSVETEKYEAILLAFGLCNNGIRGLNSKIPLVVPRAHDCITLLMGSKERYLDYFNQNPGTYYQSVGWIERAQSPLSNPDSTTTQMGMRTYQEYVEKYGEENAKYLIETLGDWMKYYTKLAYIDTEVGDFQAYKDQTKKDAVERGWSFEEIHGSLDLLLRMVNGQWDKEDFLVLRPGDKIQPSNNEEIIKSDAKD